MIKTTTAAPKAHSIPCHLPIANVTRTLTTHHHPQCCYFLFYTILLLLQSLPLVLLPLRHADSTDNYVMRSNRYEEYRVITPTPHANPAAIMNAAPTTAAPTTAAPTTAAARSQRTGRCGCTARGWTTNASNGERHWGRLWWLLVTMACVWCLTPANDTPPEHHRQGGLCSSNTNTSCESSFLSSRSSALWSCYD